MSPIWPAHHPPPPCCVNVTHLQVVVMAAEVGGDVVLDQQGMEQLQQALRGAVLRHRPDRVVSGHQQKIRPGLLHPGLQPGQLATGVYGAERSQRLIVHEVVRVSAQHHRVQHDDAQGLVRGGDAEVQLVVEVGEAPERGRGQRTRGKK